MSSVIETTPAEMQMQFAGNRELREVPRVPWITENAVVPSLFENTPPARRPNRQGPRPVSPLFKALDALTSGDCSAWQNDRSQD